MAEVPAVVVPVHDHRHQVAMTWRIRGPWAELLTDGARIDITERSPA